MQQFDVDCRVSMWVYSEEPRKNDRENMQFPNRICIILMQTSNLLAVRQKD